MESKDERVWAHVEGEVSAEEKLMLDAELGGAPEVQTMRDAMAFLREDAREIAARPLMKMPDSIAALFQAEVYVWHRPAFARGMLAAASEDRGAWFRATHQEGSAELDVRVEKAPGAAPVLSISWTADFQPTEGWTLALKPDNNAATRTFALPPLQQGHWSASTTELGFDPHDVPFEIAWVPR